MPDASPAVTLWRIAADTPSYGSDDLTGRGAELAGGRWNRIGTRLLYASTSRALACLETLAHFFGEPLPLNRYLVSITVPAAAWDDAAELPPATVGWDAEPPGLTSLDWGTGWAGSRRSLLARVPSVIVPEERNCLINPAHPDIRRVHARKERRWLYDPRYARAR